METTTNRGTEPTMLGRFQLLDSIGSGGMGTVYRAIDPALGRTVAIKVLNEPEGDPVARARLVREAQAMARLSHPNVVPVHEIGVGTPCFIVMELVAGGTLRQWLAEPRAETDIVDAFLQAGRGLAAAHDAGLVHRDFKPENILRGTDGRVRVVDFGLVAGAEREHAGALEVPPDLVLETSLTITGHAVGTPAYMAPEQHRREPTDARSDQFSFAVACYEALYSERPFAGATYREVVRNVLAGTVRPPSKHVSQTLRVALLRALSVDPSARYPSMAALLEDLEVKPAIAPTVAVPTELARSPGRRRTLAIAAGAVVAVGIVGLVIAAPWSSDAPDSPTPPAVSPSAPIEQVSPPVETPRAPIALEPSPIEPRAPADPAPRPTEARPSARPAGGRRVSPPVTAPPLPAAGSGSSTIDDAAERRRRRLELEEK